MFLAKYPMVPMSSTSNRWASPAAALAGFAPSRYPSQPVQAPGADAKAENQALVEQSAGARSRR